MPAPLTTHARVRMQQRGIPNVALEVLLDYGREAHDHRGCRIVRFDKRSRRKAARELGEQLYRSVERHLDAYAIVGPDDAVVTVGHRLRKYHDGRSR
jgi:hypothetical protein